MIKFQCTVYVNWFKESFEPIWNKSGSITKRKHWELELYRDFSDLFGITVDTFCSGRDHAGPSIKLSLIGYTFHASIYDSRHWNYEANDWEVYNEENK
jgi:hypothetical protein